jgi:hypothetical protein
VSSEFLYRLRIEWSGAKYTQNKGNHIIPIYAFKPGLLNWRLEDVKDLDSLKLIIEEANQTGKLDICSNPSYCQRALVHRTIDFFELHIKDRTEPSLWAERRTVATITSHNLSGSWQSAVNSDQINMTYEGRSNDLAAVKLFFPENKGVLKFSRV